MLSDGEFCTRGASLWRASFVPQLGLILMTSVLLLLLALPCFFLPREHLKTCYICECLGAATVVPHECRTMISEAAVHTWQPQYNSTA